MAMQMQGPQGHPNISRHDGTPSSLCRVVGLTSEEGKKKNGSVGYVNTSKKFGSGVDARHPVCLDGFKSPMSIKAANLQVFSEDEVVENGMMVAIGRRQFFDTRYIAILRRNGESLGETPVGSSPTPRAEGNLCAVEMALKNRNHEARGSDGPILFMLSDLNLARALNRAALGEDVRIAAPLNKRFQRIRRILPKDGERKVMVKYDPHRLWPDKFWTKLEKLGTQRYEAAKLGMYQIHPSSHPNNLDALELFYADGSGKRKDVTIQHELYIDYGPEEAAMYPRHVLAMEEAHRLYPEVLAGSDPHAFWSAILWMEPFMKTMKRLQLTHNLPPDLLDEWQTVEVGRQKSLDHFKASMDNARFDPALLRRPEERWGITSNEEQHMQVATDYTICAYEAIHRALRGIQGISSVVVVTCGQFRGTEMWRYIRGTTMFIELKEKKEEQTGQTLPKDNCILLYRECMESLGFNRDSKYWEGPAFLDMRWTKSTLDVPSHQSKEENPFKTGRWVEKTEDLPGELKDRTSIDWVVGNFLRILMIPILGTDYDSPSMWNVLYKPGAKERIHNHMVKSFIKYISKDSRYQSTAAVKRLVGLEWSLEGGSRLFDQEPILRIMQKELYAYLKEEEMHYD